MEKNENNTTNEQITNTEGVLKEESIKNKKNNPALIIIIILLVIAIFACVYLVKL